MKFKKNRIIFITILLILFLVIIYIFNIKSTKDNIEIKINTEKETNILSNKIPEEANITLEISGIKYTTNIKEKATVFELMEKLKNEKQINFKDKDYVGMGKFIEEINGIKNGEKNWVYYVNNQKAQIGISNFIIKPGDVVSWKYESSI